jgi:DsbC/DsbD-like thiol-disulfide interchange protein
VRVTKVHYPPGKPLRLAATEEDLSTYDGSLEIRLELDAGAEAAQEVTLRGALHYQACDDRVCLPPDFRPDNVTSPVQLARRHSKAA